jgi:hypothetical protein
MGGERGRQMATSLLEKDRGLESATQFDIRPKKANLLPISYGLIRPCKRWSSEPSMSLILLIFYSFCPCGRSLKEIRIYSS